MKKFIAVLLLTLLIVLTAPTILVNAKQLGQEEDGGQAQTQTQTTTGESEVSPAQNQHETQTENQGEEQQVKAQPDYQPEITLERMAEIGSQLGTSSAHGKQLHDELDRHEDRQLLVQKSLEELDERGGWIRKLLGPNYRALGKINNVIEQNSMQIRSLQSYETQVSNQADLSSLRELIGGLGAENVSLQQRVKMEEGRPGMLGWLFRLFA